MIIDPSIRKEKRALLILYILAVYILFQLTWWGWHLIQLNSELLELKSIVLGQSQQSLLTAKIWMVIGEGLVFFIMLSLGFWYIKRTVSRELLLARMEKTFLLSVTHELKTPISAIKLFLETLKTRNLSPEKSQLVLQDALRETRRLQTLTENILLATRLDQRNGMLVMDEVNISVLIKQEVQRFSQIFEREILSEIDADINVSGDSQLLTAMIVNLIENAIKYGGDQKKISLALHSNNERAVLIIKDEGIGIPEIEKQKIFEKFYRVGNEGTRTSKGTGLGLYITKNIVRLHHGIISVQDNQPCGSVFTISLPIAK